MSIPLLIAIPVTESARFSAFYEQLLTLQRPEGTKVRQFQGACIARARNVACQAAIDNDAEYLLMLDDDQAFAPDMALRLLSRQLDIVSGTYLLRRWPFHVCAFSGWKENGQAYPFILQHGQRGVQKVSAVGGGALMIKVSALRAVPAPWFTTASPHADLIAEDFDFCQRMEKAGFDINLDLDVIVGHMANMAIWPMREGDQWMTVLASGGERIPIPVAAELLLWRREEQLMLEAEEAKAKQVPSGLVDVMGRAL